MDVYSRQAPETLVTGQNLYRARDFLQAGCFVIHVMKQCTNHSVISHAEGLETSGGVMVSYCMRRRCSSNMEAGSVHLTISKAVPKCVYPAFDSMNFSTMLKGRSLSSELAWLLTTNGYTHAGVDQKRYMTTQQYPIV